MISAAAPGLVPKALGWGEYQIGESSVFFYIGDFHDMDLSTAPDPADFASRIAELHSRGRSPNGMFGFPVPTIIGIMERTVTWETS